MQICKSEIILPLAIKREPIFHTRPPATGWCYMKRQLLWPHSPQCYLWSYVTASCCWAFGYAKCKQITCQIVWLISIHRTVHSVALSKRMIQRWHILLPQSIKVVWQGDNKPFSQTQLSFLSWDCWALTPMIEFLNLTRKPLGFGKSRWFS